MPSPSQSLRTTIRCACGNVEVAIDSESVLRLVCYCKDCRGYYKTLNTMATAASKKTTAQLDSWGGVDWTTLYPNELKVLRGSEYLTTCIIRPKSKIHRVYSTCCFTPMFTLGQLSAMVNSHLIQEDAQSPVRFRIMGRQALKNENKPSISWSVPLSWFLVMPRRVKKEKMTPTPLEIPKTPTVLENFKEG